MAKIPVSHYDGPMVAQDLFSLPFDQLQSAVENEVPVYVLVNPIEYHGPHLSLYTDRIISLGMAQKIHGKLYPEGDVPFLIGKDICNGTGPTPGPGSVPTSYWSLRKEIRKTCKSLIRVGVKKIIFMTFHGAPLHNLAIESGIKYCQGRGVKAINPFNALLQIMIHFKPELYDGLEQYLPDHSNKQDIIQKFNTDFHAGAFETSLCLYFHEKSVSPAYKKIPDCPNLKGSNFLTLWSKFLGMIGLKYYAQEFQFAAIGLNWVLLRPFPGYSGTPQYSSVPMGEYFACEEILPEYMKVIDRVFNQGQKGPRPIMKWMFLLTFFGLVNV